MLRRWTMRIRKVGFAAVNRRCWIALARGIAPAIEHCEVIEQVDCDQIIDVGGNRGQFTLLCRTLRPELHVDSFEPIPSEAECFRRIHGRDPKVCLFETALGEKSGKAEIHISRSRDSSSLLPIGDAQKRIFENTDEVGTLLVDVSLVDDFIGRWKGRKSIFLKLDVQGFELPVLRGAVKTLKQCRYVYAECSHMPLYVGQKLYGDVAEWLHDNGFQPIQRLNEAHHDGQLVQADYLFERR